MDENVEQPTPLDLLRQEARINVEVVTNGEYELVSPYYLLFLPVVWLLGMWGFLKSSVIGFRKPTCGSWFFDGLGSAPREVRDNASNWRALDIIYNLRCCDRGGIDGVVSRAWNRGMMNTKGVRNRLRLTKRLLKEAIRFYSRNGEEVRILSIASGSAQAVIEAVAEVKGEGILTRVCLLDVDRSALDTAKSLAFQKGVKVETLHRSAKDLPKDFCPHIVEMVGFLDYRPHHRAVSLTRRIHQLLKPGGTFLACNIHHNLERIFVRWVIDWWMIYRRPYQLLNILTEGGFDPEDVELIFEPQKVHLLAVAKKNLS